MSSSHNDDLSFSSPSKEALSASWRAAFGMFDQEERPLAKTKFTFGTGTSGSTPPSKKPANFPTPTIGNGSTIGTGTTGNGSDSNPTIPTTSTTSNSSTGTGTTGNGSDSNPTIPTTSITSNSSTGTGSTGNGSDSNPATSTTNTSSIGTTGLTESTGPSSTSTISATGNSSNSTVGHAALSKIFEFFSSSNHGLPTASSNTAATHVPTEEEVIDFLLAIQESYTSKVLKNVKDLHSSSIRVESFLEHVKNGTLPQCSRIKLRETNTIPHSSPHYSDYMAAKQVLHDNYLSQSRDIDLKFAQLHHEHLTEVSEEILDKSNLIQSCYLDGQPLLDTPAKENAFLTSTHSVCSTALAKLQPILNNQLIQRQTKKQKKMSPSSTTSTASPPIVVDLSASTTEVNQSKSSKKTSSRPWESLNPQDFEQKLQSYVTSTIKSELTVAVSDAVCLALTNAGLISAPPAKRSTKSNKSKRTQSPTPNTTSDQNQRSWKDVASGNNSTQASPDVPTKRPPSRKVVVSKPDDDGWQQVMRSQGSKTQNFQQGSPPEPPPKPAPNKGTGKGRGNGGDRGKL